MMMPNSRRVHCIFCEDIRHEIGGKLSFMGVLSKDMLINCPPPLPKVAIYIKLAIVIWTISDVDDPPDEIVIRVLSPPEEVEVFRTVMRFKKSEINIDGAKQRKQTAIIELNSIPVFGDGFLEVWADTERESMRAGLLLIKFSGDPQ